jgi:hypothetical protein
MEHHRDLIPKMGRDAVAFQCDATNFGRADSPAEFYAYNNLLGHSEKSTDPMRCIEELRTRMLPDKQAERARELRDKAAQMLLEAGELERGAAV